MKHRHLNHEGFTLAAIEDVLARGNVPDWMPLLMAIRHEPFGEIARRVERVCEARPDIYGSVKLFRRVLASARAAVALQSGDFPSAAEIR